MYAHNSAMGNCILWISGEEALPGLTLILASTGSIGTTLFSLTKELELVMIVVFPAFSYYIPSSDFQHRIIFHI